MSGLLSTDETAAARLKAVQNYTRLALRLISEAYEAWLQDPDDHTIAVCVCRPPAILRFLICILPPLFCAPDRLLKPAG
jgi:hypothetical protein